MERRVYTIQHTGTWFVLNFLKSHPEANKINVVHKHLYCGSPSIKEIAQLEVPPVFTVRDPLKSIITRAVRHSDLDHCYIVLAFEYLAGLNGFIFPIDLYQSVDERYGLLLRLLEYVGLRSFEGAKTVAAEWKKVNSNNREDKLYDAYAKGDIETIRNTIPKEYALLESKKAVIRPFLEKLGYRNLLWY